VFVVVVVVVVVGVGVDVMLSRHAVAACGAYVSRFDCATFVSLSVCCFVVPVGVEARVVTSYCCGVWCVLAQVWLCNFVCVCVFVVLVVPVGVEMTLFWW